MTYTSQYAIEAKQNKAILFKMSFKKPELKYYFTL